MKCKVLRLDLTLFRQSVSSQFPSWRTLGSLSRQPVCGKKKQNVEDLGEGLTSRSGNKRFLL